MTTKVLEPPNESQALVRTAAFRLLLSSVEPIGADELAAQAGITLERLSGLLDELDGAEIELDGRRFWTWCAYDILGIFGALGARGRALSPSPPDGDKIVVDFARGRPQKNAAVLFRPDEELMSCCENVYEEWCPNSNLFASPELAIRWAEQHSMRGRVLDLDEASDIATKAWGDVI
jgi:alkylmercury lyase